MKERCMPHMSKPTYAWHETHTQCPQGIQYCFRTKRCGFSHAAVGSDGHHHFLQVWLLVLLFYMAKASAVMRFGIAAGCAGLTLAALPARLWKPQLRRLGLFALIIFASAAIGTGLAPSLPNHHMEFCTSTLAPAQHICIVCKCCS